MITRPVARRTVVDWGAACTVNAEVIASQTRASTGPRPGEGADVCAAAVLTDAVVDGSAAFRIGIQ